MPRFHIRVRTKNPKEDLELLRRAKLEAKGGGKNHIDVFLDAADGEAGCQQIGRALGRKADCVETEPAGD